MDGVTTCFMSRISQIRNDGVRLGGLAATHLDRLMQRSRHPWPEYDAVAQRRECRGLGVRSQVRWAEGRRAEAAADFFFRRERRAEAAENTECANNIWKPSTLKGKIGHVHQVGMLGRRFW